MKITKKDLEIEDIEWYALDENHKIAQFTSGGSSLVPGFICQSRENLEIVCKFFKTFHVIVSVETTFSTEASIYTNKKYLLECKKIAQKGLYCYDISTDSSSDDEYILVCKPSCELLITDLPEDIRKILLSYKIIGADFTSGHISIPGGQISDFD